jgi:DNA-binding MarR family transcriptional regulator
MATKFITVSIEVMHDSNLNQSQKFIYAEIEQLSQLDKGCVASNQHFSELIGITKENVSRNINDLEKKGYINIEIVNGTRNHTRIITLTKIVRPPYQNSKTPLSKRQETKENKTINKTINTFISQLQEVMTLKDSHVKILEDYISYRRQIKKPLKTYRPLKTFINTLAELHKNGYDVSECIEIMKDNEWQTLQVDWIRKSKLEAKDKEWV